MVPCCLFSKYVLLLAVIATNKIVVVCRIRYINTLKKELNDTKAYEEASTDERTDVNSQSIELPYKFAVNVKGQDKLRCICYINFTKDRIG